MRPVFLQQPECCEPPSPLLRGPILGVTDGSNAAPGEVGEFVQSFAVMGYGPSPNVTTATLTPLVLQPGDWDIRGLMTFTGAITGAQTLVDPLPPGMSNSMDGANFAVAEEGLGLILATARGSFTVPTQLPFYTTVSNEGPGLSGGTATLYVEARRMR